MKIIGVIGGVGSGKSTVLDLLETEYGAVVRKLDDVARMLQAKDQICYRKIVDFFGEEIVGENGELNRGKLASIVFADQKKLETLNSIVHPSVREWIDADIKKCRENQFRLYILESAILLETGYGELCDEIWYVYANEQVRRERLKQSRGYSDEKIDGILSAQASEDGFADQADQMIDNSFDFDMTRKRIGELL